VMSDPNAAGPLAVAKAAEEARAKLPTPAEQKAKYGEITLLDFPQFAKDTFPGVTHMDLYSGFLAMWMTTACTSRRDPLIKDLIR